VHDIEPDDTENDPAGHAVHATPEKPALQAVANAVDDTVADDIDDTVADDSDDTVANAVDDTVADDLDVALANAVDDTVADEFDVAVEKNVAELMDETDIDGVALKLTKELPVITLLTVAD